ncbi:hypothetical protein SADUNF_Sadunf17G0112800 [Salix dunnii]|uniref:Uncharacterized protein n=1 Tax=Salix dunnii TaxID=1413687 RepID=A0A835J6P7_9ROSI|nr:hypothetical protein SADUNF_Sadunf17G0112800 [Salix dunnii]
MKSQHILFFRCPRTVLAATSGFSSTQLTTFEGTYGFAIVHQEEQPIHRSPQFEGRCLRNRSFPKGGRCSQFMHDCSEISTRFGRRDSSIQSGNFDPRYPLISNFFMLEWGSRARRTSSLFAPLKLLLLSSRQDKLSD